MTGLEWKERTRSDGWVSFRDSFPLIDQAEAVLRDYLLPQQVRAVLDLGCGDGRLIEVVRARAPEAAAIGLDLSPVLLDQGRRRFLGERNVEFVAHDLMAHLPATLGMFDAIVSCLAIHHLPDDRKSELYGETLALLNPRGIFCDLDCDKMPSKRLKKMFRAAYGITDSVRDPSDQPARVEQKLEWLRAAGFEDVQCYWSCLGLSLVGGRRAPDRTPRGG